MAALDTAESTLRRGLSRLFALAETYPDLKAIEQFAHLQARIACLEIRLPSIRSAAFCD